MCVSLSHVQLFKTPWTVACQVPPSMGILQARIQECLAISFSKRKEYLHLCSPGGILEKGAMRLLLQMLGKRKMLERPQTLEKLHAGFSCCCKKTRCCKKTLLFPG